MRANPWLLDYIFAFFPNDDLTSKTYGDTERARAKKWFLEHQIYVSMNFRAGDDQFPLVAIGLQSSVEANATLGDVNYDTSEDVPANEVSVSQNSILGPFDVSGYNSTTGLVTLPPDLSTSGIFAGMILVDTTTNAGHTILEVTDTQSFLIAKDIQANFSNAFIAPIDNFFITTLESCVFKQTFSLKCFAQNDALFTLYLEQIILFVLLRYKEQLLEGRGFEASSLSSGPLYKWTDTTVESVYCRDITITGLIRHYWPKLISQKVQGIAINGIKIIGGSITPPNMLLQQQLAGWIMEKDPIR